MTKNATCIQCRVEDSIIMTKNELRAANHISKKSRRKKKRRTLDVSDSSSSDSDDNSELEKEEHSKSIHIEEDIVLTDDESSTPLNKTSQNVAGERLEEETLDELNSIPFTTTELTSRNETSNINDNKNNNVTIDLQNVRKTIDEDKNKLKKVNESKTTAGAKSEIERKNEYLGLLFENYGEDINALREAPDFTNKSLVVLANVLKEGSSMFDIETLKTILDSKKTN